MYPLSVWLFAATCLCASYSYLLMSGLGMRQLLKMSSVLHRDASRELSSRLTNAALLPSTNAIDQLANVTCNWRNRAESGNYLSGHLTTRSEGLNGIRNAGIRLHVRCMRILTSIRIIQKLKSGKDSHHRQLVDGTPHIIHVRTLQKALHIDYILHLPSIIPRARPTHASYPRL